MRTVSKIECTAVGCKNEASVKINDDLLCMHCSKDEIPSDYCIKHSMYEAEGGPCPKCEEEAQLYISEINRKMAIHSYSLWVKSSLHHRVFKIRVFSFDDAKMIHHSLGNCITSSRIARFSEEEGCEAYIHTFI